MKNITLSVIKADVGSIGGHTKPSEKMMAKASELLLKAKETGLLVDGMAKYTGDDICLIMSHEWGIGAPHVHKFCWDIFKLATAIADNQGCYGAGQDLLVTAPSGNIRGAGPGVAEIDLVRDRESKERPVESFFVFAADKCGPGAYNLPLYQIFCDPMHSSGLLLSPKIRQGFTFTIIDMDHKSPEEDRIIKLDVPEQIWDVAALLRDPDRYAVEAIYSRYKPDEQIVSASATRLHNIAGKYTGKDDPVVIVRSQGIFPASEECTEPFALGHYVTGGARGSHVLPLMPVPINTPLVGFYNIPIVSCLAFSMDVNGRFTEEYVDIFSNIVWDEVRYRVQEKAAQWRRQGFFGAAMAAHQELSYTGIVDTLAKLDKSFVLRKSFYHRN
jgi:fructose 1,6-bisphosphate aldolase/phosphatase